MDSNSPAANPVSFALLLFFAILIGSLLGGLSLMAILGSEAQEILNSSAAELGVSGRQQLRFVQSVAHVLSFTLPSIAVAFLAYRKEWYRKLDLATKINWEGFGWGLLLLGASIFLVAYLQYLNLQIPLPSWAVSQEDSANQLVQSILTTERPVEYILLFLTIAVVPAIGEELLTRGLIQGKILPLFLRNPHAQIWLAAFIFSAMHLELGGLLPRWALGAVFGYAYYWSRSLWVPIILHFLFNGLQALAVILSGEFIADTEIAETPSLLYALLGLVVCAAVLIRNKNNYPSSLTA